MQEPEHWGYVYFSDKEVGETVNFDIPEDEHVKWLLYENYRKLLAASEDVEKTKNGILDTGQCIMGKPVNLKIECDLYGWCIWTLSPFSGNTLLIKEDGKFENYHKQE